MKYHNIRYGLEDLFNETYNTYLKTNDVQLIELMRLLLDVVTSTGFTFDQIYENGQNRIVIKENDGSAVPVDGYFMSLIFSQNIRDIKSDRDKVLMDELKSMTATQDRRSLCCASLSEVKDEKLKHFNVKDLKVYEDVGYGFYLKGIQVKHAVRDITAVIQRCILENGVVRVWVKRDCDNKAALWSDQSCYIYDNGVGPYSLSEFVKLTKKPTKELDKKLTKKPTKELDKKLTKKPTKELDKKPTKKVYPRLPSSRFFCRNMVEAKSEKNKDKLAKVTPELFNSYKVLGFSNFLKGSVVTNISLNLSGVVKRLLTHRGKLIFTVELEDGQKKEWCITKCSYYSSKEKRVIKLKYRVNEIETEYQANIALKELSK